MSTGLTIKDGSIDLLDKARLYSSETSLMMLSESGSLVREAQRSRLKASTTEWSNEIIDGKRVIKKTSPQQLGKIIGTGYNISRLISSYLMESKHTVVIGGRHPNFYPTKRRVGKKNTKMDRVGAVGKKSHAILHKLNFGERLEAHSWTGGDSMDRFKNAKFKKRLFMQLGFRDARPAVALAMKEAARAEFNNAMGEAKVKYQKHKVGKA